MLEILTHAKKIRGDIVVQTEILDLLFNGSSTSVGVVLEACAIADFGVKELTCGEGFIVLDFL